MCILLPLHVLTPRHWSASPTAAGLKGMMPGILNMLEGVCKEKGLNFEEFTESEYSTHHTVAQGGLGRATPGLGVVPWLLVMTWLLLDRCAWVTQGKASRFAV